MTDFFDDWEKMDIADDFKLLAKEIENTKTIDELEELSEKGVPDIDGRLKEFIERIKKNSKQDSEELNKIKETR